MRRLSHDQILREAGRLLRGNSSFLPQLFAGWTVEEVETLWDCVQKHANLMRRKVHWIDRKCRRGKDLSRSDNWEDVTCKSCLRWGYQKGMLDGVLASVPPF